MLKLPFVVDCCVLGAALPRVVGQSSVTASSFSVDARELHLRSAVAIAAPHRSANYSWIQIHFYAFSLTPNLLKDVSTSGSVDALERRRADRRPGDPDPNRSKAVLHLLLDNNGTLSNASLELPGLTCTIVVDPSAAAKAIQAYDNDGKQVHVRAKGAQTCDLTSVGGGTHPMTWDVDVTLPLFRK